MFGSISPRKMGRSLSRHRKVALLLVAGVSAVAIPFVIAKITAEIRYEFDTINLRTRVCHGCIFYETCSEPIEHLTAKKLREMKILEPISDEIARWELIKGF